MEFSLHSNTARLGSSPVDVYNAAVLKTRYLPDPDRLSILAATILLAYALTRFIELPSREIGLQLPGFYLAAQINVNTMVALLVAGLTAAGADWLLRDHPALKNKNLIEHWLLPALTAWVIGIPLVQMPAGLPYYAGFALGAILLMLVMVAEYISIDPDDVRQPVASAVLTAVSFALYLALAVSLRLGGSRLSVILPALTLAAFLVSLRTLHLRLHGRWIFLEAGVIALLCGQVAAALHYWPVQPVTFGLILLGPAYALTSLIGAVSEGKTVRSSLLEPLVVLILVWGAALWIR